MALAETSRGQQAANWRVYKAADGLPESAGVSVTIGSHGKVLVNHLTRLSSASWMVIPSALFLRPGQAVTAFVKVRAASFGPSFRTVCRNSEMAPGFCIPFQRLRLNCTPDFRARRIRSHYARSERIW